MRRPDLLRIIQTDYLAFLSVLFPVGLWMMYVLMLWTGVSRLSQSGGTPVDATTLLLYLAIIATIVCMPLFIVRVRYFWTIATNASEVRGRVTNVEFKRNYGRVEYAYTFNEKPYQGSNSVQRNKRTSALRPNASVRLFVHYKRPEQAFIRDLYL